MVRGPKQAYLSWKEERDAKVLGIPVIAWLIIFLIAAILILICPASLIAFSFATQVVAGLVAIISLGLLISIPIINNSSEIREGRRQYYHDEAVIRNSNLSEDEKRLLQAENSKISGKYGSLLGVFGHILSEVIFYLTKFPLLVIISIILLLYLRNKFGQQRKPLNNYRGSSKIRQVPDLNLNKRIASVKRSDSNTFTKNGFQNADLSAAKMWF